MGFVAEAQGFAQNSLTSCFASQDRIEIFNCAQVEHDWNEVRMSNRFAVCRRIVAADPHPDDLAMSDRFERSQVLLDDFKDHFGAEIQDSISAESRKLFA